MKRKTNKANITGTKDYFNGIYRSVSGAVQHDIAVNLLVEEIATLNDVKIKNGDEDIIIADDCDDVIREVKKQLIKNKLFVTEITIENKDTLVINTTDNIFKLLYSGYDSEEYEEILNEIENETCYAEELEKSANESDGTELWN